MANCDTFTSDLEITLDCVEDESYIKYLSEKYLPKFCGEDYDRYIERLNRAIFTSEVSENLKISSGILNYKNSNIDFKSKKSPEFINDVNGLGQNLEEFKRELVVESIKTSKVGILISQNELDNLVFEILTHESIDSL